MAGCYFKRFGKIKELHGYQVPCSNDTGIQPCCVPGDTCGLHGFCHFFHAQDDPISGYYLAGCTDPEFKDAACPQQCTSYKTQDVIYSSNGLWSCCWGSGQLDCREPSDETFAAPAPEILFASSSTSTTFTPTTVKSSTSTINQLSSLASSEVWVTTSSIPDSLGTPSRPSSTRSDITTPVVATVIPMTVLLASVLGFCVWRRKVKRKSQRGSADDPGDTSKDVTHPSQLPEHPEKSLSATTPEEDGG